MYTAKIILNYHHSYKCYKNYRLAYIYKLLNATQHGCPWGTRCCFSVVYSLERGFISRKNDIVRRLFIVSCS